MHQIIKNDIMLNKISFKNYKAFSEGEVKIRPITILLGANSVGKSSIMQLFLMLQQTALSEGNYKSALKLHGGFVSLGEGVNLIRKKDSSKVLSISIDFYSGEIFDELKDSFRGFCDEFSYFAEVIQENHNKNSQNFTKKISSHFFTSSSKLLDKDSSMELDQKKFYKLVDNTHKLLNESEDYQKIAQELQENYFLYGGYRHRGHRYSRYPINHFQILEDKEGYLLTYDFLKGITDDLKKGHFKINYDIIIIEKLLVLNKVSILNGENEIISIEFDKNPSNNFKPISITSKYIDQEKLINSKILHSIKNIFVNPTTIFSFICESNENRKNSNPSSVFASILRRIINSFNTVVSNYFEDDNINYVSPLRAHPKRYYFLDKAKINVYMDTFDGDAIAEVLKENKELELQVNAWFKKFNLNVKVDQLQDIIHKLVVNQNALDLDITDVGFGISQVLPVIIQGFLSHENSITLIEQPEIHLHPKMQAELADLFIDIVSLNPEKKNRNLKPSKYLFIETHSEYLLKRLRRRISEGKIAPENVAIYLIDPQTEDEGGVIKELKIQERGHFDWPVDFYGGELLKDTTEFIKNQQRGN